MAIVKMKRLTLLALQRDREKLLDAMQKMQCVEVTPLENEEARALSKPGEATAQALDRLRWALQKLGRYDTQPKPSFGMYPAVDAGEAARVRGLRGELLALVARLEAIERTRGDLRAQETRIRTLREQYLPWAGLDASAAELSSTRTLQLCGTVPTRGLPALAEKLSPLAAVLRVVSQGQDDSCVYIAVHPSCADGARQALEGAGFSQERFAPLEGRTPAAYLAFLDQEERALTQSRQALEDEERAMAARIGELKTLHDIIALENSRAQAARLSAETEKTFLMQGWVPARMADRLRQRLLSISPSASVEISEPREGEEPTILLQNSAFSSAFEPVVEGFALPSYGGIDPTAVMAPFYVCLFGMMVSDAAYGLIMALAVWAFVKIKKIPLRNAKLLYLLMFGGLSTVVWGLAFNTVMGFSPLPKTGGFFPLDAVNDPMPVMMLCLGIGALHLFAGLGVAAYMNIRRGDIVSAVSDQASWFLLLAGLGLMLAPGLSSVGQAMALAGAAIILLMKGRGTRNPVKRLLSGLGALYGITGWISDLLSYMRLFGMGLATGVIGMVFNILIGMVWSGGILAKAVAVVLFIGCHLFNLGINALGAYVHSCRLQYIEFFGKFYEDGGRPFRPLDLKTRYVNIREANTL